jgi:hypothetical protein
MASSIHPMVRVTLDKERNLCYGAAAFIEFKEHTGQDLLKFMRHMADQFERVKETEEFPLKEFRDILWAGLIHEDPDLKPRDVSNMFTLQSMLDIMPLVMEAFALGMPRVEASANGNPHPALVKSRKK